MLEVYYRLPNCQQEIEEQICRQILARCKSNRVIVVGDLTKLSESYKGFGSQGFGETRRRQGR